MEKSTLLRSRAASAGNARSRVAAQQVDGSAMTRATCVRNASVGVSSVVMRGSAVSASAGSSPRPSMKNGTASEQRCNACV